MTTGAGTEGRDGGLNLQTAATSWLTPRVTTGEYTRDGRTGTERATIEGQAAMWKTPDVPNGGRALKPGTSETGRRPDGSKAQVGLENQTRMWGTPRASDGEKGGPNMAFGAGGTPLPSQAANWPTPAAQNVKGSSPDSTVRADGKSRMDILHYAAEQGFSRPARETQTHGRPSSDPRLTWRRLRRLVISTHGRAVWKRMAASGGKRRLNPNFVAFLMGWPIGHPSCACSETEWCRFALLMRGALSALPTASGPWVWKPPAETQEPVQMSLL